MGLKQLALEDQMQEEQSHETGNVEQEGKSAQKLAHQDGSSEREEAQDDHENVHSEDIGEPQASASSS